MPNAKFILPLLLLVTTFSYADQMCDAGLESFEKTVYPLLRERCVNCHGDGGISVGHAVSNVKDAYSTALGFTLFNQLENSIFVNQVRQKHWLEYDSAEKGATTDEVLEALSAWWSGGQSECGMNAFISTSPVPIPTQLPLFPENRFVTLSWELQEINPLWKGMKFLVDIQRHTIRGEKAPGSYRVVYPRVESNGQTVDLSGIRFLVSGQRESFENVYEPVSVNLSSRAGEVVTLSQDHMILLQRNDSDTLTVQFRNLKEARPRDCRALDVFKATVEPMIQQYDCKKCHSPAQKTGFEMSSTSESLCAEVYQRVLAYYPQNSVLLGFPYRGKKEHPKLFNAANVDTVLKWIRKENSR